MPQLVPASGVSWRVLDGVVVTDERAGRRVTEEGPVLHVERVWTVFPRPPLFRFPLFWPVRGQLPDERPLGDVTGAWCVGRRRSTTPCHERPSPRWGG